MRQLIVNKTEYKRMLTDTYNYIILDDHPKDIPYYVAEHLRIKEKNITNDNLTGRYANIKIRFFSKVETGKDKGKLKLHIKVINNYTKAKSKPKKMRQKNALN